MRNALTFMKYSPLALCAVFLVGVGFKFKFNTDDKKSLKKKILAQHCQEFKRISVSWNCRTLLITLSKTVLITSNDLRGTLDDLFNIVGIFSFRLALKEKDLTWAPFVLNVSLLVLSSRAHQYAWTWKRFLPPQKRDLLCDHIWLFPVQKVYRE